MGCQPLGNLRIGNTLFPVFLQGKFFLYLRIDILNTDNTMLSVSGHDFCVPNVDDPAVHHQTVDDRKRAPVLQIGQHDILIMNTEGLLLIFRMYIFTDGSSALGKKIISCRRNIQLLKLIRRKNLAVGTILYINVVDDIILLGKTCAYLII